MDALRSCNTRSFQCLPAIFPCQQTLKSPSSSTLSFPINADRKCIRLFSAQRKGFGISASPSGSFSDVDEEEKKIVASEKAVEGVNEVLHETARKVSHKGGDSEQVKHLEDAADAVSEEASEQATKSGNAGDRHEGISA